jgi:hypothetical protein
MPGQEAQARQAWHEIFCDTLKRNSIQLVTYVPDNVPKPTRSGADHRPLHVPRGDEGLDRSMP